MQEDDGGTVDDTEGGFLPEEDSGEAEANGEEGGFVRENSETAANSTARGAEAKAGSILRGWKPDTAAPPTPDAEEEEDADVGGGFLPEDAAPDDTAAPGQAKDGNQPCKGNNTTSRVRGWKPDTSAPPTPDAEEEEAEEDGVSEDIVGGGGFLPEDPAGEGDACTPADAPHHTDPSRPKKQNDTGPVMMVQPPTWACPEYRVVPVGGFIPESEDRGGAASGPAPLTLGSKAGTDELLCKECGASAFNEQYRKLFDLIVCKPENQREGGDRCIAANEDRYKLMTKTAAKEEFLVNDGDLAGLNFLHKSNPRKEGWNDMKLYLRLQVRAVSWERWGGARGVAEEKEKRVSGQYERRKQLKQRESILRQQEEVERTPRAALDDDGSGGLSRLAKSARTTSTNRRKGSGGFKAAAVVQRHTHQWGEDWWDGEKRTWKKRCVECNKETSFEKL